MLVILVCKLMWKKYIAETRKLGLSITKISEIRAMSMCHLLNCSVPFTKLHTICTILGKSTKILPKKSHSILAQTAPHSISLKNFLLMLMCYALSIALGGLHAATWGRREATLEKNGPSARLYSFITIT